MKRLLIFVLILLSSGIVFGNPDSWLNIENDGSVRVDTALGRTTWTGIIVADHSQFKIKVRGRVSLFGGVTLQKKTGHETTFKSKNFTLGHEYISLVALGKIEVQVKREAMDPLTFTVKRFVYVFKTQSILLDSRRLDIKRGVFMDSKSPPNRILKMPHQLFNFNKADHVKLDELHLALTWFFADELLKHKRGNECAVYLNFYTLLGFCNQMATFQ